MFFEILRQFTKGNSISILSEFIFLSKFCIGISGLTLTDEISCSTFSMSPCVIGSSATIQCLSTKAFRHEIFQLSECQFTCVRGHLHIESSHSLHKNDVTFQTHSPNIFHTKMPNLSKINVYNFRYKKSAGILMKLIFFHTSAQINQCINQSIEKYIQRRPVNLKKLRSGDIFFFD